MSACFSGILRYEKANKWFLPAQSWQIGTILRSLSVFPTEKQLKRWILEIEEAGVSRSSAPNLILWRFVCSKSKLHAASSGIEE